MHRKGHEFHWKNTTILNIYLKLHKVEKINNSVYKNIEIAILLLSAIV
jgi:hypothetical protein